MEILSVGVIGAGNIGTSHARSLSREVAGAQLSWLYDADVARANALAAEIGARVAPPVEQLIASSDAVVIASPDALHAEQALICLDAQRPTLCEKPLAPTVSEATSVVDAEIDLGQRLISLGFMRRFDPGYVALKESLSSIGQPLIVHNVHRNEYAPYGLTTSGTLTNSAIHEIDINRWLLDDDYATVQVVAGKPGPRTPEGELDPILMLLTTRGGVIVEVEAFVNAAYGYEVRCEVVGSEGTVEMGDGSYLTRRAQRAVGHEVPELWLGRFEDAYRRQLQAWVDATRVGTTSGATAWDGLLATITANAAVTAITYGPQSIELPERPSLYR
ncbi:MAG: Gfo/Idh/MocA family protein [Candidatus Nanopelagicales bacterium]